MTRPARRLGNLPAELTSFVGRRHETTETRRTLTSARLVTLVGPGGVGKSRLALRVAQDVARAFPDGTWFVDLAEVVDPDLVPGAVLAALDVHDHTASSPAALVQATLRDRRLLLVVDGCEHLRDATAHLVRAVLRTAPDVRVLATSREPLGVAGEHVLPVPPLGAAGPAAGTGDDAVRLFVDRAAAATGSFALTPDNEAAVVELCRRLDGLPLAIELAAARVRTLSPHQLVDRLTDRFTLLTGPGAGVARHGSLADVAESSHALLGPTEQVLLRRVGVFGGRFTLVDVEGVCNDEVVLPASGVLDALSSLVDKSFVHREVGGRVAAYRMHETMRDFARGRLDASGERAAVESRWREHVLTRRLEVAPAARLDLLGWLDGLAIDDVRAVLRRSLDDHDVATGLALASATCWYWATRATSEGVRWLDALLTADPGAPVQPWACFTRGFLAVLQHDPDAAAPVLARGAEAARAAGAADVLSQSLAMASVAAALRADHPAAADLRDEATHAVPEQPDPGTVLMLLQARSLGALLSGDPETADRAAADGARLGAAVGDVYSTTMMLMNRALAAVVTRRSGDAEAFATQALPGADALDDRVAQSYLLGVLACCAAADRDATRAAELLGASEHLAAATGGTVNSTLAPALVDARAAAVRALGVARFAVHHGAGGRLPRAAAVDLALRRDGAPRPDELAPLARRESEVARLVAEGLTNKEIGARLFISDRTVETHVRSILAKLGMRSRAQVAGWAAGRPARG